MNDVPQMEQAWRARFLLCIVAAAALVGVPALFSHQVLDIQSSLMIRCSGSRTSAYWHLLSQTAVRTLQAAALTFAACFVVAIGISTLPRRPRQVVETMLAAVRFTPAVSWLPLTIALVGTSTSKSQIVFVMAGAAPLVLFHLLHGLRACSPQLLLVARLSGATAWASFRLRVAAAQAEVFHALRLTVGIAFVLCVVYGMLFPSIEGVERLVEWMEVTRYPKTDFVLQSVVLLSIGILLDQTCGYIQDAAAAFRIGAARRSAKGLASTTGSSEPRPSGLREAVDERL